MNKFILVLVAVAGLVHSETGFAWAEHHLITHAALANAVALKGISAKYVEPEQLFRAMGFSSAKKFNESIYINKNFKFEPKLNEAEGQAIKAIDILAMYCDEPDWVMDQNLFDADQYPELWKEEYKMMGGKKGTPSQSFRHMYWAPLDIKHPLRTFKLPVGKIRSPMGEAPKRARLFIDLSRRAKQLGFNYWSYRFLANALHYLEDVSSPFHGTQTPTKKFIVMPVLEKYGQGRRDFVKQVTSVVAYYHFAFEDYIAHVMSTNTKPGQVLHSALSENRKSYPNLKYQRGEVETLVLAMAKISNVQSAPAARASLKFFPEITKPYNDFDAKEFMDQAWWNMTIAKGEQVSQAQKDYFEVVEKMFSALGFGIRELALAEILQSESQLNLK